MNANVTKNGLRLALGLALLFGGVVFQAASVGSATEGIPFPPKKPAMFQSASLVAGETADENEVTTNKGNLTDDEPAVPVASPAYRLLHASLRAELREGRPTYALKLLEKDPLGRKLKAAEYDRLQAAVAQSYLSEGKLDKARALSHKALSRSGLNVPLAGWVGGIAAWRMGDYKDAAKYFAFVAEAPSANSWLKSAGAYWAARSAVRAGNERKAERWLQVAAAYPRTFYGLIAIKALGDDPEFNWSEPTMGWGQKAKLAADPQIAEAFRLAGTGQLGAAVGALSKSPWMKTRAKREQVLAYALKNNQTALVLYLARTTKNSDGEFYDSALYPVADWQPKNGYQVDKALVYALVRQESRFNPHARSGTGATGLMQLLPSTARYMNDGQDAALTKPDTNLAVGQKYVRYLLGDASVNNDLFRMMVAYNAGPGNLARWKTQLKDVEDPLLFIESIPSPETRAFVERVMVNYWIYRMRMGQDTPSLDAIADTDDREYAKAGEQHEDVLASR